MKTNIKILLSFCFFIFFISCEDNTILTPVAKMTISNTKLTINESMVINFTGTAQQVAIYTGDDSHNYELRTESNTGFVVNKGLFTYAYSTPGTYKVVCIASTYSDLAKEFKQDTCSYIVTVIDSVTTIDKISCPQIIYDEVYAEKLQNDEWIMRLPRKVKYNTSTPSVSLLQKLKFYIESDSTKIYINDNLYNDATKYDLSNTAEITVVSDYGTSRSYKLYTIYYPEFSTFKIAGVEGVLIRSAFNYSTFEMNVTLPAGIDVSNITPEFSTVETTNRVYIGNIEQISGSSVVDFTKDIKYHLISTSTQNSNIQAESTVVVKINYR